MREETVDRAKTDLKTAQKQFDAAIEEVTALKKKVKAAQQAKDPKLEDIKKDLVKATDDYVYWLNETQRLDELVKNPVDFEKQWADHQAYPLAGYRLVMNTCNQCHDVGQIKAKNQASLQQIQGPSLNLASERLRADWVKHWVSNPQRLVPYPSLMPIYFAKDKSTAAVPWMPNEPELLIDSARDTILNLPTILDAPLTRYWIQVGPSDVPRQEK
jgi:hypothetical protein